jgi:hypothetical protein
MAFGARFSASNWVPSCQLPFHKCSAMSSSIWGWYNGHTCGPYARDSSSFHRKNVRNAHLWTIFNHLPSSSAFSFNLMLLSDRLLSSKKDALSENGRTLCLHTPSSTLLIQNASFPTRLELACAIKKPRLSGHIIGLWVQFRKVVCFVQLLWKIWQVYIGSGLLLQPIVVGRNEGDVAAFTCFFLQNISVSLATWN